MSSKIAAMQARELARNTAEFITGGMAAGKIHGSMKGMWERAFQHDAAQARKDLEAAPVVAPVTGRVSADEPKPGSKREQIITTAANEYATGENKMLAGLTKEQCVRAELAAANLDTNLTDADQKLIG
jgi:hypothetical protein